MVADVVQTMEDAVGLLSYSFCAAAVATTAALAAVSAADAVKADAAPSSGLYLFCAAAVATVSKREYSFRHNRKAAAYTRQPFWMLFIDVQRFIFLPAQTTLCRNSRLLSRRSFGFSACMPRIPDRFHR